MPASPARRVGRGESVSLPSPSWPSGFDPQHDTRPSRSTAQVWPAPADSRPIIIMSPGGDVAAAPPQPISIGGTIEHQPGQRATVINYVVSAVSMLPAYFGSPTPVTEVMPSACRTDVSSWLF